MVLQVVWSRTSLGELRGIKDYYVAEAGTAVAQSVVQGIREQVELIARIPFAFPAYAPSMDDHVRHSFVGVHRIFYRVEPDKSRLRALKIWHTARREPRL